MNRLIIYMGGLAACVALCAYIWFQGVEHGRNEILAEQNVVQAEAQQEQDTKDAAQRQQDITADKILSLDLSDIQDTFHALQQEVPHVELVKPQLPDVPCPDPNPFTADFVRLFQDGARGRQRSAATDSGTGDGTLSGHPPDDPE